MSAWLDAEYDVTEEMSTEEYIAWLRRRFADGCEYIVMSSTQHEDLVYRLQTNPSRERVKTRRSWKRRDFTRAQLEPTIDVLRDASITRIANKLTA